MTPNEKAEALATELIEVLDKLILLTNRTGLPFGAHGEMWFALDDAANRIRIARTMARNREWTEDTLTK